MRNVEALASQQATSGSFGSSLVWRSEIDNLPPARPLAPDLPEELLPTPLRPWLADIAERMQVPLEFTTVPALVSLAAVVGRQVAIHPKAKDDWLVVPNLWGGIIARPGMLKSPALKESLNPIRRLVAEAREEYERRMYEHGARLESLKAKDAALKSLMRQAHEGKKGKGLPEEHEQSLREVWEQIKELEESLVERRYITNDPTVEKLGELFAANPMGLLLERDELAGWLRALEKKDRPGDREFYLEAWNGTNPYSVDRIGRGSIHIPAVCLSIVGGIQPAKLARYVAEALEGGCEADGLLQRFQLLVWPEDQGTWELLDRAPDLGAREVAFKIYSAIDRCEFVLPTTEAARIPTLRFAADAQELFYEWLSRLEGRLRSQDLRRWPAFESHLAKYRSLMPTLALLFHLVEMVASSASGAVTLTAAKLAADWCEYLEQHAMKVYVDEVASELIAAHALARKIREGAVHDGLTVRDTYHAGWADLKTPDAVTAGLKVLEDHGWLQLEISKGQGRPSQLIRLNPALKERET